MANTLGFGLGVTGIRKPKSDQDTINALETAALAGSISYRDPIPLETLRHALLTGVIPPNHIAQLRAVLDEASLNVLSAAAEQIEVDNGVPRKDTWQKMRQLARATACMRGIWS
ncbi:hypothetical protein LP415_14665 [Polaromonas sp. P1(28)-8]|nr:hypothetical protein LP415_14665 [Polaromonas sp. P1(28)-8]